VHSRANAKAATASARAHLHAQRRHLRLQPTDLGRSNREYYHDQSAAAAAPTASRQGLATRWAPASGVATTRRRPTDRLARLLFELPCARLALLPLELRHLAQPCEISASMAPKGRAQSQ